MIVTGIAQPYSLEKYVKEKFTYVDTLKYPDHHYFNKADITLISDKYEAISNNEKAIIVTEKDAVKLRNCAGLSENIKSRMFFLPLEILFLQDQNKVFNQIILDYVTKNKRNR